MDGANSIKMKYLSWKVIQILACCLACPSLRILPEKALIPSVLSPLHRTTKILALARVRDFQILAISPISAILAILLPPPLPPGASQSIPGHPSSACVSEVLWQGTLACACSIHGPQGGTVALGYGVFLNPELPRSAVRERYQQNPPRLAPGSVLSGMCPVYTPSGFPPPGLN